MKHWFKDRHFRSLLKNTSYLAISRVVAAIASLATLAFAGRSLGVALFGMLILIHSYAQAASALAKFNSWQIVVRYGSPGLERGDPRPFKAATGFAVGLDLLSGSVSMVAAAALLPWLADWFEIPPRLVPLATGYCLVLLTMGAAAPNGVLRALDRFDLLSWHGTMQPIARAVLSFTAWMLQWPFEAFVVIWFATEIASDVVIWSFAIRELKRNNLLRGVRPTLRPRELQGVWRFAVSTNANTSLNAAWGPIARLLISAILSPAAAGLYRVASSIADAAQRPADFLNKAIYPQLMRLDPRTKHPWRLILRAIAFSVGAALLMCLVILLFGDWLLREAFGQEFVAAYPVLVVLLGVPLVAMLGFPLPSMLHAVDRTNTPLAANVVGVLTFVALLFLLGNELGLVGAGAALVAGRLVMTAIMAVALSGEYRRLRKGA